MGLPHVPAKIPLALRYQTDPARPEYFRLVGPDGTVWAGEIPTAAAARLFAAASELLRGYDGLLEEAHECFHLRWDLGGADLSDFLEIDDDLEDEFPGAAAYAKWLQEQSDRSNALRLPDGGSPIERYVDPQGDLFLPRQA